MAKKDSKRKHFTTSLDPNLLKEIKKLAIDLDCSVNELLEEAIKHLLEKHKKKFKK
jgi:metal-responsive CopG/Arc/MetJ family transcriptional regulator